MKFYLKNVILEGPDCSGKSTTYRELHRLTKFKWNIQDRSTLSMLCYAILYRREVSNWDKMLRDELSDLNNVMVVLLPPLKTILERLDARGDEFQDVDSITKLYTIFERVVSGIEKLPNVFVCRSKSLDYKQTADVIIDYEDKTYDKIALAVEQHADASIGKETINLHFSWSDRDFKSHDPTHLQHPKEVVYYTELCERFTQKIRDEFAGRNSYNRAESISSRRFVITQDTCISFVQALVRDCELHVKVVCRSSEVSEVFKHDIHAIAQLGKIAISEIGSHINCVHFDVNLGSAHIIRGS